MKRKKFVSFRVSDEEQALISSLAIALQRSESDVIRRGIWELANKELSNNSPMGENGNRSNEPAN